MLHLKYGVRKVLIVCTVSGMGVWRSEIRKHLDPELRRQIRFVIVNYQKLYKRHYLGKDEGFDTQINRILVKYGADIMIVDESHRIGNPATLQSKLCYAIGRSVPYRLIMTGTPLHRKPLFLFGQARFMREDIFGTSYGIFKKTYAIFGGYLNKKVLKYRRLKHMRRRLAPWIYHMKEVPKLPPVHQVIPVQLQESEGAYAEMAKDSILELKGKTVTAPIILTQILRLHQITGGWVKDEDGDYHRIGAEKLRVFKEMLEDFTESEVKKIVVFCRFIHYEYRDVVEACKEAGFETYLLHGGVGWEDREQRIAEFDETELPSAFIAQISTGSESIDLSAASVAVFYSLSESLVDFEQAQARIRKWADKVTRTYYYLTMTSTVDEGILATHRAGLDLADTILNNPDLIYSGRESRKKLKAG